MKILPHPPPLSHPFCQSRGTMKTLVNGMNEPRYWNHIATFGKARLITSATGRVELLGGSPAEHAEAQEWISLFLHDAVLQKSPTSSSEPKFPPCRRRRTRHTPPQTFWFGCRSAVQRLVLAIHLKY